MPRLLTVNNYYYYRGGAETVFLDQNRILEDLGWTVAPFSMRHPRNLETPWAKYFVEEIEFGARYSLAQKFVRVPRVIYSLQARRRLSDMLDVFRPDLCHAHNIYHHISPSILGLLKGKGIPIVLTLHDLKIACPAYQMLTHDGICERCRGGRLYNVVLHKCIKDSVSLSAIVMLEAVVHRILGSYNDCVSRFVVPSAFFLEKLVQWGFPPEKFRYVPNFVDVGKYLPDYTPGKSVLYLGRVSPEKGLGTLVRAAAVARCKVAIVGTGPEVASLRQLALELNADVRFLGYLTGAPLHEAVRSARAVVLPSVCYENAPMSVLEAYALGKPVLGASIGGIPELIRENQTGLRFPSGDVAALAETLRRIFEMRDSEVGEMGRCGRQWVESEFTAAIYADRIMDTYRELGVGMSSARHAGA